MSSKAAMAISIGAAAALVAVVALLLFGGAGDHRVEADPVVRVAGVAVSGLDRDEARRAVAERLQVRPVIISAAGKRERITPSEVGFRFQIGRALNEAEDAAAGAEIDVAASVDQRRLERAVARFAAAVDRPVRDASIDPYRHGLELVAEQEGRSVRQADLGRRLGEAFVVSRGGERIGATLRRTRPEISRDELADAYPVYLIVDKTDFKLRLYEHLKHTETYPIAVGAPGYDTPEGRFEVTSRQVDPAWSAPIAEWAGSYAGTVIPGGSPENPLKERWLGIVGGVGIHGTADVWSMGTAASHGCIRMIPADVIELYDRVPLGTPVLITS